MNDYTGPMEFFSGASRWARRAYLPGGQFDLHLYDTGGKDKPAVVLLHGLGDEADTWRMVIPLLIERYRVIAPDLPGFGRSLRGKHSYTTPFFVETARELLDALNIQRATLAGHSNGALVAQAFALAYPQRVERLALISGSLLAGKTPLNLGLLLFLMPGVGEWMYTRLRKDPQAAYRSLAPYYNDLDSLPQTERDFLYRRVNQRVWSDGQRRGFLGTLRALAKWLPAQQQSLPERLRGWNIPTTIAWGENDRLNSPENGRALKELLPGARLVVIAGAGHNVQQEQPRRVAQAILGEEGGG